MNDGFKQRLVGAIVLTCIALILWPVLFSDGDGPEVDRHSQIPPMPAFEKYEVPEPARPKDVPPVPETMVEAEPPEDQVEPDQPKSTKPTKSAPVEKPRLDDQGLPSGWVLQVASFSQLKNAGDLKAELQQMGYKAYTRQVKTGAGTVARVYIGPKMSKQAFDGMRAVIDKKYKVNSIVVKYEP